GVGRGRAGGGARKGLRLRPPRRRREEGVARRHGPARPVPRGRPMTRRGAAGAPGAFIERQGARYALLDVSPDLLVALQDRGSGLLGEARAVAGSTLALAGDLATFPPADLLNFLHNGERDGVLLARSEGFERAVVLVRGNVAWAVSSSPGERFGEVACRMGLLERSRLQQI